MIHRDLVQWQKHSSDGFVLPWLTHPFLKELQSWELITSTVLELGAGWSTAWWRSRSKWVDSIEANKEWYDKASLECLQENVLNGDIIYQELGEGEQAHKRLYLDMIPLETVYNVVLVDGIWRYEAQEWALHHLKARGGLLIVDNWQQDGFVCPAAEELMKDYEAYTFEQEDHVDHHGRKWCTAYWKIPPDQP